MRKSECERLILTLDHLAANASSDDTGTRTTIIISTREFRTIMADASATIKSFMDERESYLAKLDAIVTAFSK